MVIRAVVENSTSLIRHLLFTDYVLTKGNIFIGHLYNGNKTNKHYYYHHGWNVQAVIAYICGIALPFPGFVGTLGPKVSTAAANLGSLGWLLSFFTSFVVYFAICSVWPTKNQRLIKEMGLTWEEQSAEAIFAEDGTEIVVEDRKVPRETSETSDGDGITAETYGVGKNF